MIYSILIYLIIDGRRIYNNIYLRSLFFLLITVIIGIGEIKIKIEVKSKPGVAWDGGDVDVDDVKLTIDSELPKESVP